MNQRILNAYLLLSVITIAGCATAQQLIIKADMAYATSVFALDDAEYAACHSGIPTLGPAECAILDPQIAQSLKDVQSVTKAIQLFPTIVPKDLSTLLADLNNVQSALLQLQQVPVVQSLAAKTADANAKAIALLKQLTGAK
jgi:hypothetical protein